MVEIGAAQIRGDERLLSRVADEHRLVRYHSLPLAEDARMERTRTGVCAGCELFRIGHAGSDHLRPVFHELNVVPLGRWLLLLR